MKKLFLVFVLAIIASLCSCSSQTCVLVQQARGIGIRASYNTTSQLPEFWMGYIGQSLVLAPSNRQADTNEYGDGGGGGQGNGAKDVPNVITDFQLSNFFSFWRSQGVYERVAIGDEAIKAAKYLMVRDSDGKIDPNSIEAIEKLQGYDAKLQELNGRINVQQAQPSLIDSLKIKPPEVKP